MANIPLKGIKILGLENTYTVAKNIEDGDGENNLLQSKDADSWSPSNSEVIRYIANEIGTADDGHKIQANEDGSVKVGAYGKFATSLNGKSQSLGKKSFTSGSKNIAFESNAHAEGNETFAAAKHSHAEGNTTAALGAASHAEGLNTKAGGDHSHAEGGATEAIGEDAHAEGFGTHANGRQSHAEGYGTNATADGTHAEGYFTVAHNIGAHTEGYNSNSGITGYKVSQVILDQNTSTAYVLLSDTSAFANWSSYRSRLTNGDLMVLHILVPAAMLGVESPVYYSNELCVDTLVPAEQFAMSGRLPEGTTGTVLICKTILNFRDCSIKHDDAAELTVGYCWASVAKLSEDGLHVHTYDVLPGGEQIEEMGFSHAEGYSTKACGLGAHSEGFDTRAFGPGAHAEGWRTSASGAIAHAEGKSTQAYGIASHAEGENTVAYGHKAHAEGTGTGAYGENSHAEGLNGTAGGDWSHVEGDACTAEGIASHAEGARTHTIGAHAHAEGMDTWARGNSSHAEGISTEAFSDCSHAEGEGTITGCVNQHVQGQYNKVESDKAFIIGNGNGPEEQNRKNAMTVDWDGNGKFSGDVTTGNGNSIDDLANKLIDITTALDSIIAIQESLIGGAAE